MKDAESLGHSILIADDDEELSWAWSALLERHAFEVERVRDGDGAMKAVSRCRPDLMLLDFVLPDMDGLEVLRRLRDQEVPFPVVMITAFGSISSAVEAMRLGAYDYLTKPIDNDELLHTVRRALEKYDLERRVVHLEGELRQERDLFRLMGTSEAVKRLNEAIGRVSGTEMTVVVQGETGTGKEIVAREIHRRSLRAQKPFVPLDCGAIPEGLLESEFFGYEKGAFTGAASRKEGHFQLARGGTLLLDEVSNLPVGLQRKLLRVLQERRVQPLGGKKTVAVDIRIIASTNEDLGALVEEGSFRRDLYHRLSEFLLVVPPLRERREDILYLAKRFLDEAVREVGRPAPSLTDGAVELLLSYEYPGNVRELRNMVRRAVLCSEESVEPEHLMASPPESPGFVLQFDVASELRAGRSLKEMVERVTEGLERKAIEEALSLSGDNKAKAAGLLQIDRKTLYNKLKK